jgi:Co/Zn/Cd efflux system component
VLADALTSVLAIIALLGGRYYGLTWLDAAMGIVGAVIILRWSSGLVISAGKTLLDIVPDNRLGDRIRSRLEIKGDRVVDLHLWRLGPGHAGMIASVVSDNPREPDFYKRRLGGIDGLARPPCHKSRRVGANTRNCCAERAQARQVQHPLIS